MASWYALPELEEFLIKDDDGVTPDYWIPGIIPLKAAEAVRTHDIATAKIVYAICSEQSGRSEYREQIGETLYTKIIAMIEEYNAAKGFSFSFDTFDDED